MSWPTVGAGEPREDRRAPDVAVVVADDVEAAPGQLRAEVLVPAEHLRAQAHDEQQGGIGGIAEGLEAELDVADAAELLGHATEASRSAWRPGRAAGAVAATGTISFCAWRSGAMRTTSHTRPSFSIARMTPAEGSSSRRPMPCTAERGKAWWLWCHASPSVGRASQKTLVEWSSTSKRRRPRKWQTELIDHVTWWMKNTRTRPPQSRPVSAPVISPGDEVAGEGGGREARDDDPREGLVDLAHPGVVHQVGGVLALAREALLADQPAHVGVDQPAQAGAAAHVRAVRIALLVGVRVVLAVVGDPGDHGPLHRHRAENREEVLDRLAGRERAMGQQAMEADRHAEAGQQVHDGEEDEVVRAHAVAPEQDDGGEEGDERDDDGEQIRDSGGS